MSRCVSTITLALATVLAGCETPVSLKEPARAPAPLPPLPGTPAPLPAPALPPLTPAAPPVVVAPSAPPAGPAASAAMPSPVPTPVLEPPLLVEQRWLNGWFSGTPVVIAMQGDGALLVEVPMAYAFDGGEAEVKPPLAAVLDRVATSLLRQRELHLLLDAPADEGTPARLALERATRVRQHLASRGVDPQRVTDAAPAVGSAVQLRLRPPAGAL